MSKIKKKVAKDEALSAEGDHPLSSSTSIAYLKVLKDYSLLMEYKRLKQQSPTGVYVLPAADSLRRWYGVIFIRKGHYRGGVFKFVLMIPPTYPDDGPKVHFLSEVFHPLIHPDTGLLDLSIQFPTWSSNQHYIVLLLCYIKKIFYKTEYWESRPGKDAMNPKAQQLWITRKDDYLKLCEKNCAKSQSNEKLYSTLEDSKMSIKFERPRPAHEEAYRRIVGQEKESGLLGNSYLDWFQDGVFKLDNGLGPVPTHLPPVTGFHSSGASSSSTSASSLLSVSTSASANFSIALSPISPDTSKQTTKTATEERGESTEEAVEAVKLEDLEEP